ncbi:hypothetical protein [Sphingomonas crusticola]|uniref:hypothetical protein n=1 Tax=Sphingomonas crusticola TaxID=1697973 RepID=UPI000E23CE2F|nr:hypothetical protein [Sphingomonas crusticola]
MADTRNGGGKRNSEGSARKRTSRNKNVAVAATGVAIGIGSAALVAALLYANRPQEDDEVTPPDPRFEPRES